MFLLYHDRVTLEMCGTKFEVKAELGRSSPKAQNKPILQFMSKQEAVFPQYVETSP